jgi:hypothetical protein
MHCNGLVCIGITLCAVSCSKQTTQLGFRHLPDENSAGRPASERLNPPSSSLTNYVIDVVQPTAGRNFAIRTVQSNPTNHYAMRYFHW